MRITTVGALMLGLWAMAGNANAQDFDTRTSPVPDSYYEVDEPERSNVIVQFFTVPAAQHFLERFTFFNMFVHSRSTVGLGLWDDRESPLVEETFEFRSNESTTVSVGQLLQPGALYFAYVWQWGVPGSGYFAAPVYRLQNSWDPGWETSAGRYGVSSSFPYPFIEPPNDFHISMLPLSPVPLMHEGDPAAFGFLADFEDDPNLTTVPEPMTIILLATGLLGIGGIGLARRRKAASLASVQG